MLFMSVGDGSDDSARAVQRLDFEIALTRTLRNLGGFVMFCYFEIMRDDSVYWIV